MEEAETLLGACHMGHFSSTRSWFTRDGKLLTIFPTGLAELVDLPTGEAELFAEKDTVCVIKSTEKTTRIVNEERWNTFLKNVEEGAPDAVTIRNVAGLTSETAQNRSQRYDGMGYTLSDETGSESFAFLIADADDTPPARAEYSRAVYFLLSDDPEMNGDRYYGQMTASKPDPEFPRTKMLFTVYEFDD